MEALPRDPARTALLVMDLQRPIVERFAAGAQTVLDNAARAIAAARSRGVRVIYVVVGFRAGFPEVSARNPLFSALPAGGAFSSEIDPRVAPAADEVVITKHRVGAFHGTDLEMVLRAQSIETLVLCGISTSGVVLSTLRHAADADYRLIVLRDACMDMDAEVHACLMDKVFPRQATVVSTAEWVQALA